MNQEVKNYREDRALIVRTDDTHNAVAYADALAGEVERLEHIIRDALLVLEVTAE